MISRAGMNTNFGTGTIKFYELPKAVRTKPINLHDQLQALSKTFQEVQKGSYEHHGDKFVFEEGKQGACFSPTKEKTGLNFLQSTKTGDIVTYQEKDLKTGKPASISLIQADRQITINDDEDGSRGIFNTARAIIQDQFKGK